MPEGQYKAETTLNKFANIYLKNNNTKYADGAKHILLMLGSTSLFFQPMTHIIKKIVIIHL